MSIELSIMIKRWFVVHTKLQQEQIAKQHLDNQALTVFLSFCRQERRHARKITIKISKDAVEPE